MSDAHTIASLRAKLAACALSGTALVELMEDRFHTFDFIYESGRCQN